MTYRLALALVVLFASTAARAQTTRPVAAVDHVLIFSIDGGRPDLLLRANCPAIRSLMVVGCYSFWARTTAMAITLPSHVSMLTGVIPQRHGIMWNDDIPLKTPVYPKFPTLFDVAHAAGYSTALVSGKGKFKEFIRPGSVDYPLVTDELDDERVTTDAVAVLRDHRPQVLFVHFPGADVVGHAIGWGTPEQMAEIEKIDGDIGQVLAAEDQTGLREHTVIVLTADHGGAGRTHGPDDARSRHIPWIIAGPGIRKNYDLAREPQLVINTEDTFATACFFLAIKHPIGGLDGRPVREVLENRELLEPNPSLRVSN